MLRLLLTMWSPDLSSDAVPSSLSVALWRFWSLGRLHLKRMGFPLLLDQSTLVLLLGLGRV